jgi:hypothetical protein
MTLTLATMADYVNFVEQEREEQWKALAVIRGHSFPDCRRNNGRKTSYLLLDAYGEPIKDKKGKCVEITSEAIGREPSFNACLKQHGFTEPLTQLTGHGKDAIKWFRDYQIERYERNGIKLDEGAMTFIDDNSKQFVPRRIMWNKHYAYEYGDKSAFAGDPDIHRYVLAMILENDIKAPAIEAGKAAANSKLLTFSKYVDRARNLDLLLADEMQSTLNEIQRSLSEEVPLQIDQYLSKWSSQHLLPEILNVRRLVDGRRAISE